MTMRITIIVFIDGLLAPNQTNGKRDYRRNLKIKNKKQTYKLAPHSKQRQG